MAREKTIESVLDEALNEAKRRRKMVRDESPVPSGFGKWKWGGYGWTSPVNLLITAAAIRCSNPHQDVCKIWSKTGAGESISGGYSIRTIDESKIVPFVTKHDLATNFCSPNSGMQGSRAIEKSRGLGRVTRGWAGDQRTSFDITLFSELMNDINDSDPAGAYEILVYLFLTALEIKDKRHAERIAALRASADSNRKKDVLVEAVRKISDPEFVKCVAAAMVQVIFGDRGSMQMVGVESSKTAADARDQKPGDFWLEGAGGEIWACEVKDPSRLLDWQNIRTASDRIISNNKISAFLFITCRRQPFTEDLAKDLSSGDALGAMEYQERISFVSIYDLLPLIPESDSGRSIELVSEYLAKSSSLKPGTVHAWTALL